MVQAGGGSGHVGGVGGGSLGSQYWTLVGWDSSGLGWAGLGREDDSRGEERGVRGE